MIGRIGLLIAALSLAACAVHRYGVANYAASLRLAVTPQRANGRPGDVVALKYTMTNQSEHIVEGCISEAKGYNLVGVKALGHIETVAHPPCVERFRLGPAQHLEWLGSFEVLAVGSGLARLNAWVELADPTRCDQYGCDAIGLASPLIEFTVEAAAEPDVTAPSNYPLHLTAAHRCGVEVTRVLARRR